MKLYGLAVAITGKNQPLVDVTCTTIGIDEADPLRRDILPEHSFIIRDLDPRQSRGLQPAFNRAAASLSATIALQEKALASEGVAYRPVTFLLGHSTHIQYGVKDVRVEFIRCTVPDPDSSPEQIKISQKFADDLEKSYLRQGGFSQTGDKYSADEVREGVGYYLKIPNSMVRDLAPLFNNPSTQAKALHDLKEIADYYGGYLARIYADSEPTLVLIQTPNPDYIRNPELQARNPIYSFASWHPEIRAAVVQGFKKQRAESGHPVTGNIYYKPNDEKPSPFYVDVITALIWDQLDVLRGRNTVENIAYQDSRELRYRLVNTIRRSAPVLTPEPAL